MLRLSRRQQSGDPHAGDEPNLSDDRVSEIGDPRRKKYLTDFNADQQAEPDKGNEQQPNLR